MNEVTVDYCKRRIREERHAAATASSVEAAIAHRRLAREFAAKARALKPKVAKPIGEPLRPTLSLRTHQ